MVCLDRWAERGVIRGAVERLQPITRATKHGNHHRLDAPLAADLHQHVARIGVDVTGQIHHRCHPGHADRHELVVRRRVRSVVRLGIRGVRIQASLSAARAVSAAAAAAGSMALETPRIRR